MDVTYTPSVNEVSELGRHGGGVGHARWPPFHHQLQLFEDVHVFGEWVRKLAHCQLKLHGIQFRNREFTQYYITALITHRALLGMEEYAKEGQIIAGKRLTRRKVIDYYLSHFFTVRET